MSQPNRRENGRGAADRVGNSRGMRVPVRRDPRDKKADTVFASFLQFLEKQLTAHPADVVAADVGQLRRVGRLVQGVDVK